MIYKVLKNCMTKYFDKLLNIKLYIFLFPSHGNMKDNVILGHVDFLKNSLDIINKNIFHNLMSKKFKEDIHLNKNLSKSLNLNILTILEASTFLFNFMVSRTLAICFPFFWEFF